MADFTDKPGYAFGEGPPRAVAAFLKGKPVVATRGFRALEPEEHAVAFTVAQSAKFDILEDVREALVRSIERGETFETFRRALEPTLVAKGWWGRKTVDGREVQLGSPRRLKTIYRANLRSAFAAGQWGRIERTKEALPYLVYLLGPSERHRPHHAAKEGWVLPVDHPFWDEWFPPNGWGCKCHVRQVTASEAERRGITRAVNIPRRDVRNPATGAVRNLPSGLDPAWSGNPGKTRLRNAEAFLEGKLQRLADHDAPDPERTIAERIAAAAAKDIATSWRVARIHEGAATGAVPIAVVSPEAAARFGARVRTVLYSDVSAKHIRDRRALPLEALAGLHDALADRGAGDGGRTAFLTGDGNVEAFGVGLDGLLYCFVVRVTRFGEMFVKTAHRAELRHLAAIRRKASRGP